MRLTQRRAVGAIFGCSILICCAAILVRSTARSHRRRLRLQRSPVIGRRDCGRLSFNTLGVAYMNQQRPADAQKYFEQASRLTKICVARLNLGVSLLAQQMLEPARAASKRQRSSLPKDA